MNNDDLRFPRGVYGVTPEWDDTNRLLAAVDAAFEGGMVALQWRRKSGSPQTDLVQARRLADRCRQLGLVFIVNDDWRLAALVDADGVHLGRDDGSLTDARLALGPQKILGCSCYNDPSLAAQALLADVDYIAFGAMYPSSIKPGAPRATLAHIAQARAMVQGQPSRPRSAVVAIGGLTPDNAAPVVQAGADSIALISGLFESPDIRATAAQCASLFNFPG